MGIKLRLGSPLSQAIHLRHSRHILYTTVCPACTVQYRSSSNALAPWGYHAVPYCKLTSPCPPSLLLCICLSVCLGTSANTHASTSPAVDCVWLYYTFVSSICRWHLFACLPRPLTCKASTCSFLPVLASWLHPWHRCNRSIPPFIPPYTFVRSRPPLLSTLLPPSLSLPHHHPTTWLADNLIH